MKKYLVLAVLVVVLVAAGTASAAVLGTKHDMTSFAGATGPGFSVANSEICVYCHTPHNASTVITTLLWNKTAVSTLPYTPYANAGSIQGTISATMGQQTRICLSCHDGSVGVFVMNNPPNSNGYVNGLTAALGNISTTGILSGTSQIDRNFQNDHPVSIQWPVGDTGVPAAAPAWAQLFGAPAQMECGTCHDVHGTAFPPFLRMTNSRSSMCRSCHTDK